MLKRTWLTLSYLAIVSTAILGLMGCDGRISQCNRVIEVINAEQEPLKDASGSDAPALRSLASLLDNVASKVSSVRVEDDKLIKFRNDYATMAKDLANAARETASALLSDDSSKAAEAAKNMSSFGSRESELVDNINQYCSGSA
jgi:hypothetical protein